jgi:hypothetical protein
MKKLKKLKKLKNIKETVGMLGGSGDRFTCVWWKRPFVFPIYIYCFIYTQFFWIYHMVNFLLFGDMSIFDVEDAAGDIRTGGESNDYE